MRSAATHTSGRGRRFGRLGLDLAPNEPTADQLELLADVQLAAFEVDLVPGQTKHFTLAQAEHQDQDEGRVKRLAGMPCRFEEPPGVIDGPGLRLAARSRRAAGDYLDLADRVAADHLVIDRTGKRGTESVAGIPAATEGENIPAALPDRATTPLAFRSCGIFSLGAVLADNGELIEPLPHILHFNLMKALLAEIRDNVQTAKCLVPRIGKRGEIRLHYRINSRGPERDTPVCASG